MRTQFFLQLVASVSLALVFWPCFSVAAPSIPVVSWAQGPGRLHLTLHLPDVDVSTATVTVEDQRIYFHGVSRGREFEVDLKLLRPINVTASSHEVDKWKVHFDLTKLRREPCWLRLQKKAASAKRLGWLKKDHERWQTAECQMAKEMWREAFFSAKMRGVNLLKQPPKMPEPAQEPLAPPQAEAEKRDFERRMQQLRDKAVPWPRQDAKKKKSAH